MTVEGFTKTQGVCMRVLCITAVRVVAVVGCVVLACAAAQSATPAAGTPEVAPSARPPVVTPAMSPSPAGSPTPDRKKSEAECKKAVVAIGKGDLSAFKALRGENQAELREVTQFLSCIAIARDDRKYCDSLPKPDQRNACLSRWELVKKLKTLPKDQPVVPVAAPVLQQMCKDVGTNENCVQLREAMATNNAAKCSGLPDGIKTFCEAVIKGDAGLCKNDETCKETVVVLTKLKTDEAAFGGEGGKPSHGTDSTNLTAAHYEEKECTPLLDVMTKRCEGPN